MEKNVHFIRTRTKILPFLLKNFFLRSFLAILDLTILPMTTTSNNSKQTNTNVCPIEMITPYLNGMYV